MKEKTVLLQSEEEFKIILYQLQIYFASSLLLDCRNFLFCYDFKMK